MYIYDIIIDKGNIGSSDDLSNEALADNAYTYLALLQNTRQIVPERYVVSEAEGSLTMRVLSFETEAFKDAYHSRYGMAHKQRIERQCGCKMRYCLRGSDPDNPHEKLVEHPASLILRYGWESPLLCGDTYRPIPLYRLFDPRREEAIYDTLRFWESTYRHLYGLWLASGAYETFAQKELEAIDSDLNKEGLKLRKEVEALTGSATYYHLFNDRNSTVDKENARRCPLCGGKWRIEGEGPEAFIAFRCDRCRLVSEFSPNAV